MAHQPHDDSAGRLWRAVLLVGPPGVGKGTQGRAVGQLPGFSFVSMGELLRSADPSRSPGREAREHLHSGTLVPAKTVLAVWEDHMKSVAERFESARDVLLLDGLPRTTEQARRLRRRLTVEAIVHLACADEDELLRRIRARGERRADDYREGVIRRRFEIYREQTLPVLDLFPPHHVHTVDAGQRPVAVLRQVAQVLERRHDGPDAPPATGEPSGDHGT
jgi:adenylate kinase